MVGKYVNYSRRRVLRASGTALASVTGVPAVTAADPRNGEPTVEIVTVRRGSTPVKTEEVPESWYHHLRRARRVNERVQERRLGDDGVLTVGIGAGSETIGGKRGFEVRVQTLEKRHRESLPTRVDGVPVNAVTRKREARPLSACTNTSEFDSVPGGVHIGTDPYSSDNYGGTISAHVYDGSGNLRTLSANHVFGESCGHNDGTAVYQGDSAYGTVESVNTRSDTALVSPDGDESPDYAVKEDDSNRHDFYGHKTRDGIATLISNRTPVYKTGITTGTTSGPVEQCEVAAGDECQDYFGHGVISAPNVAKGDSGAPVYETEYVSPEIKAVYIHTVNEGEGDLVGNVSCGRSDRGEFGSVRGMGFYHLNEAYGLEIA